jgi:hypothetical protein
MLQIVSESCPTKIFLANPEMNRDVYREAFHLNDTELDLIAGLVPPVLQKNLKTFVYLGAALLVIVAALFSSTGKKTPTMQAAAKGQPPQPMGRPALPQTAFLDRPARWQATGKLARHRYSFRRNNSRRS